MNDPLTDLTVWAQILRNAERTICCSPEYESRIKCWVDARGLGGVIKVKASRFIPEGQIFVVDRNAIDASMNERFF